MWRITACYEIFDVNFREKFYTTNKCFDTLQLILRLSSHDAMNF